MRHLKYLTIFFVFLTIPLLAFAEHNYKPDSGYVPNAEAAIKIALAVWEPIYGKKSIKKQKPYKTTLNNNIWTVTGSLPGPKKIIDDNGQEMMQITAGGVALIKINKLTGCILRVSHGK